MAAAEAVAAVTVEVVPTTAAAAAAVDDVAMLVVGDVDVDGAVVESVVLLVESRPTTLSLLPFLNIPFSSVIFAHFVGGNAFNLRNR